jgi:hypothetical protein
MGHESESRRTRRQLTVLRRESRAVVGGVGHSDVYGDPVV